jgi:phosphoribosyl-AMP cyclohydrolase
MDLSSIKFDNAGLVPAIVQEASTGEVLMLAYMNSESIKMTLDTGYTHFWSRSRRKFWKKGETSGNVQEVHDLLYDCDGDTLLVKVKQHGKGACHTGERTCCYRSLTKPDK